MPEFTLYWTGKIPLGKVKWILDSSREVKLDPVLEKKEGLAEKSSEIS